MLTSAVNPPLGRFQAFPQANSPPKAYSYRHQLRQLEMEGNEDEEAEYQDFRIPEPGLRQDEPSSRFQSEVKELRSRIDFIKAQHSTMITALQREIEDLKNKNKELQFQLVFRDGSPRANQTNNSATKDLDQVTNHSKIPKAITDQGDLQHTVNQLQCDLDQARSRNAYLVGVMETQKKKLDEYEWKSECIRRVCPSSEETQKWSPTLKRTSSVELHQEKFKDPESLIADLRNENFRQQLELQELRESSNQSLRLKYRGCNNPASRLLNRPRQLSTQKRRRLKNSQDDPSLSPSRYKINLSRSESVDRFPPLKQNSFYFRPKTNSQSPMLSELPPVPGSSGSESSSSSRPPPLLNLVSLPTSNEYRQMRRKNSSPNKNGPIRANHAILNDLESSASPTRFIKPFKKSYS